MSSPELEREPLDSDALGTTRLARPVHLTPAFLLLVGGGGTVGTAAREALSLLIPPVQDLPVAIFGINLVGAFVLGLLLDALARSGPDEGRRRKARLLLGTGFCGGFTTFSSLATATALLLTAGAAGSAALYAVGSIVLGGAAAWAGIACGALVGGRR